MEASVSFCRSQRKSVRRESRDLLISITLLSVSLSQRAE